MQEVITIDDTETAQDLLRYIQEDKPLYEITKNVDILEYEDEDYRVTIPKEFIHLFEEDDYSDKLIFGKNPLKEIVSIEVKDNKVFLFLNNGEVQQKPMIYWILANKKLDKNFTRLQGNQHYKYIRKFRDGKTFRKFCGIYGRRDIFKIYNEKEAAMIYYGYTMFKGLKVKDVSVLSFDIEANGLTHDEDSQVFLITNTFRDTKGNITKKHFRVDHYTNDTEMIEDWCKWVVKMDPTVLNGHNIFGYDLPYLQYCYGEELPIGKYAEPAETVERESKFRVDGNQEWSYNRIHLFGRHILDGMFLAVKYDIGRKYPSWGLKPIAEFEGIIKEGRQFYDASKIGQNWHNLIEREKIIQYGIDDSDDSMALYDIHIPSIFYMTQSVPKPLQLMHLSASGAQLNAILVRAYMQDNYSLPKASERTSIAGGISFGIPGIHRNVFKIDVASEYPSIIRKFRVYPIEKDPKMYYTKMVDHFTEERFKNKKLYKKTKDRYYDDLQAAQKIFINSSYGLTSTNGLNFNDFKCGAFITGMGRQIIKESLKWATSQDLTYWWKDYKADKDELYDGELFMKDSYKEFTKRKKLYEK